VNDPSIVTPVTVYDFSQVISLVSCETTGCGLLEASLLGLAIS